MRGPVTAGPTVVQCLALLCQSVLAASSPPKGRKRGAGTGDRVSTYPPFFVPNTRFLSNFPGSPVSK